MKNFLRDPSLLFRLRDGSERILSLIHICDRDVIDFALLRADFQGAAYQLAIAILQTIYAPQDEEEWLERYHKPPNHAELESAFKKIEHAFNVSGDGPLFMQDFDPLDGQEEVPIERLLIDVPGEQTIKNNTDFFIKRESCKGMSPEMANIALYTLQINAPSGGKGYRTGLRGGGPITTLICPQSEDVNLWQKVWLNVINREHWKYDEPNFQDGSVFPWMEPTREGDVYAKEVHPLHMYWAMPRRIRLQVDDSASECGISGKKTSETVRTFTTKNYGNNYSGDWRYPLTPYRFNPDKPNEDSLSVKGKPGGINYNQWSLMTLNNEAKGNICADVVNHYQEIQADIELSENPRLWVFGYDMDNMKARCWYSATMPLFHVDADKYDAIITEIERLQSLAELALKETSKQIKSAWFERPKEAKGDFSFINAAFWPRTEQAFYIAVQRITRQSDNSTYMSTEQAKEWLNSLRNVCMTLFDEYGLFDETGEDKSVQRRIIARLNLKKWLFGKGVKKFCEAYNISTKKDKAQ